ncbi:MAG TPA: ATP-binding protein [Polyangia bacterium]|jgi:signal transduction histidine kinase
MPARAPSARALRKRGLWRDGQEMYRALLDAVDYGFNVLEVIFGDGETPDDFRFVYANAAFDVLALDSGVTKAIGRTRRSFKAPVNDHALEYYVRVARTGQSARFTTVPAALAPRVFDVHVFPLGPPKEHLVAVVFSEITDQCIAEEKLAQAARTDAYRVRLTDALRRHVDPTLIQEEAARLLGQHLQASRVRYTEFDPGGKFMVIEEKYTLASPGPTGRMSLEGLEFLMTDMQAGRSVAISDSTIDRRVPEATRKRFASYGIVSLLLAPLLKANRVVACVALHQTEPRTWTAEEIALVEDVAERTWSAVETSRAQQALQQAHQQEIRLREAALQASQAKDEFLAMLGHELRNPLTPILATLELMRTQGRKGFAKEREAIERQARHLAGLVDDLMDATRISRGKISLHRGPVELRTLVAQAVEATSPLFEERGHHLDIDVPVGLVVHADDRRIVQAISNLLTNACRYTASGGRITVTARLDGATVELVVRDNGVGIGPALLPHVFDLFHQGPQGRERPHGGLGLGLSIARTMVTLHDGIITAHSDGPGQGSAFVVRLPLATVVRRAARPAPVRRRAGVAARRQRRILVVDDNRDVADVLGQLLRKRGHQVKVAYDGISALTAADSFRPTLALLDIGLPGIDGYELARRFKRRTALHKVKLVAVTGYGQPDDRKRATQAGFASHIVKPIDFDRLLGIIEEGGS